MKFKVICLIFIFNMVTMNHASAFFLHNNRSDNLSIEDTPIDQSTQDNNILYLYDNSFAGSSENYLSKKKGAFIFADQIKINIPMNILLQDSIYPENSIDRMMLANLRAKKLFDEYSDLQKRARLILQDNGIPGEKNDGKKNSSHIAENINIDEKNEAIQKTMSHINFLGHLSKDTDSEQNSMILDHLSSTNSEIDTSEKDISYIRSSEGIEEKRGAPNTDQQSLLRKESRELPWILNVLLKLLNYIVSNRLEIMLYMIFMSLIVFLISLKIKK